MICFNLLSIRLLQSHDLCHSFNRLTKFNLDNFFIYFLWDYTSFILQVSLYQFFYIILFFKDN